MDVFQSYSGHRYVLRHHGDLSQVVQLLAFGFLIGCTFAPTLKTFTGLIDLSSLTPLIVTSHALPEWILRVSMRFY